MKFYDFEYDGLLLSDYGFMTCNFDSDDKSINPGSQLEFNLVSGMHGTVNRLIKSTYNQNIEFKFQICKKLCKDDDMEISVEESRKIFSWLNRKSFHKFKIQNEEYIHIYFIGSFNISTIEINGKIVGFELNFISNKPFALHENIIFDMDIKTANGSYSIYDKSDEEGFVYPHAVIYVLEDGDLTITNGFDDRVTFIRNCVAGEVITLDYPKISTSEASHEIQNDFNWNFIRICNSFIDSKNTYTASLPCRIILQYSPIVKITM